MNEPDSQTPDGFRGSRHPGEQEIAASSGRLNHDASKDDISLFDIGAVLLRHRWTIVFLTLIVPIVAVAVTAIASPSWTASTSFTPQAGTDEARSRLSSLAGQVGLDVDAGSPGQTPQFYADLIRSREILGGIAADTFSVVDTASLTSRGRLQGPLYQVLDVEGESPALRRATTVDWLRDEAVSVATNPETGIVSLSVTTSWSDLSAEIAARILDLVNDFNLRTRQSQAAAERRFIEERMAEAQEELRSAENDLQTFLQNNRQFQNSPELVFEHDRIQRRVSMRQQVYTSLVESYEQARINEVRNTPVITVVEDVEQPVRPDSRALPVRAALGVLGGALLGVTLAFGREYLRRQREEDDEAVREVSVLWEDTKADVKRFIRRVRPS